MKNLNIENKQFEVNCDKNTFINYSIKNNNVEIYNGRRFNYIANQPIIINDIVDNIITPNIQEYIEAINYKRPYILSDKVSLDGRYYIYNLNNVQKSEGFFTQYNYNPARLDVYYQEHALVPSYHYKYINYNGPSTTVIVSRPVESLNNTYPNLGLMFYYRDDVGPYGGAHFIYDLGNKSTISSSKICNLVFKLEDINVETRLDLTQPNVYTEMSIADLIEMRVLRGLVKVRLVAWNPANRTYNNRPEYMWKNVAMIIVDAVNPCFKPYMWLFTKEQTYYLPIDLSRPSYSNDISTYKYKGIDIAYDNNTSKTYYGVISYPTNPEDPRYITKADISDNLGCIFCPSPDETYYATINLSDYGKELYNEPITITV